MNLEKSSSYLASPDSMESLSLKGDYLASSSGEQFPLLDEAPLLFPKKLHKYIDNRKINIVDGTTRDAFEQYMYINSIKMYFGVHNEDMSSEWYAKHIERSKELFCNIQGSILDIGCDVPEVSKKMFPGEGVHYLGLDPLFEDTSSFKLIGMAESLPIRNNCLDNVVFNTSLDHVFDYYKALTEASRVLSQNGKLYLSTLVWSDNSELYNDHHHFHHFKEYEIFGVLSALSFEIHKLNRYPWKNNEHRTAVYIEAKKK
jgi:SAM-dependent methyltransferase